MIDSGVNLVARHLQNGALLSGLWIDSVEFEALVSHYRFVSRKDLSLQMRLSWNKELVVLLGVLLSGPVSQTQLVEDGSEFDSSLFVLLLRYGQNRSLVYWDCGGHNGLVVSTSQDLVDSVT